MPLIRKSASDVTTYRRISATNLPVPTIKSSGYTPSLRNLIPPIARASDAGAGVSPANTVLGVPGGVVPPPPPPGNAITGSLLFTPTLQDSSRTGSWFLVSNPMGDLSPGTADFTIEWWQSLIVDKGSPVVFNIPDSILRLPVFSFSLDQQGGTRKPIVIVNGGGRRPIDAPTIPNDNAWAHFAIVRRNDEITLYYNGTVSYSFNTSEEISATDPLVIGSPELINPKEDTLFDGNITNFRWVTGTAVYTSNFTPSLNNLPAIPGTKLLFLATSPATALTNSGIGGYDISNYGTVWSPLIPTLTPPPPPGGPITGSLYFQAEVVDSTLIGSWISASNPMGDLSPTISDFTIEWWQYLMIDTGAPVIFTLGESILQFYLTSGQLSQTRKANIVINSQPPTTSEDLTVLYNTWAHFAIVRSNDELTIYLNGQFIISFSSIDSIYSEEPLVIGARSTTETENSSLFEGNITNFRWVTGTAVYTSNFTPSLNNLPPVAKTQLLLLATSPASALTNSGNGLSAYDIVNYGTTWSSSVPT